MCFKINETDDKHLHVISDYKQASENVVSCTCSYKDSLLCHIPSYHFVSFSYEWLLVVQTPMCASNEGIRSMRIELRCAFAMFLLEF